MSSVNMNRRNLLLQSLFGAGMWGLRSLATGLPVSFLLNPRKALAGQDGGVVGQMNGAAQYVIFNTSENGDPINANVPGTFITSTNSAIGSPIHPPTFTSTPWTPAALGSGVLDKTVFFHHSTNTVVHPDEPKVLHLMNTAPTAEMFPSMLAAQLAPQLGTIQTEPVALGSETITFQSRPQPNISPLALVDILGSQAGVLGELQSLRDKSLNQINAVVRSQGNKAQQGFIDRYVLSQGQARQISQSLLQGLSQITGNDQNSQLLAALTLIQMNVAPVVTVHIDFGGDNHTDSMLATETSQTTAGIASIATLMQNLQSMQLGDGTPLADRVTFVSLNVFGRTLAINNNGTSANGRSHQGNHHCAILIGAPFKGGTNGTIIGGIEPDTTTKDYKAQSIDATTGAAAGNSEGGADIVFADTLNSMAKTVCAAVGVSPMYYNNSDNILGGQVVTAALAST
jgi:hypothetical protein